MHKQEIGHLGEQYAIQYLKEKHFKILHHHFTTHWGELDIVAQKRNKICFVEVKTRIGEAKGKPYEAVGFYKLRSIKRAANTFLLKYSYKNYRYSVDVISIELRSDHSVNQIDHFESVL
ncbi:MAG: YraN family protein [Patescibacteria group bacterium]